MNTISVIIPIYNADKWLNEALRSLQTQSFSDFDVIMVDDGSTDKSAEICQHYCDKDSRFRLISQPNKGVSSARNHGIDIAEGDWIAFMDADDIMPPDALEIMSGYALGSGAGMPEDIHAEFRDICQRGREIP